MKAEQVILSRGLPKTGQTIACRTSDDGYIEAGWWQGRGVADNKTRFIAKTLDGDDVVIDLATGLMWAADETGAGCSNGDLLNWNNAIDFCNNLDFAGFTNWRLANILELASLANYGKRTPAIDEPPFANTSSSRHWSSTTQKGVITNAWDVDFADGIVWYGLKTGNKRIHSVRGGL